MSEISEVIRDIAGGVEIRVFCKPGAGRRAIAGLHGGALKVKVRAGPIEGKANDALIELIAEALRVPRSRVTLKSGARSRWKAVRVAEMGAEETAKLLEEAIVRDASL